MSSKVPWSLPEGVDEILPPKAIQVEKLRRSLLDLYLESGYEYVIPPLLEYKRNLGGKAHDEIIDYAFSFKDEISSEEVSIRPDISEQAARIDAYRIKSKDIIKLCYAGDVVKSKSSPINRSRSTIQVGAEIFGDASMEAEIESICLMIDSLKVIGVEDVTISLSSSKVTALVLNKAVARGVNEKELNKALNRKSESDLMEVSKELDQEDIDLLLNLSSLYGGEEIIDEAKKKLSSILPSIEEELIYLRLLVLGIKKKKEVDLYIDLGETLGFKYHTGVVFAAYVEEAGHALAKGGRYDGISDINNHRPAVGFDLDLLAVTSLVYKEK
ncbi:MAG: ATP phosphoribosyltransferase regulatory subunit [Gammaproteobacteria bacterium]